MPRCTSCNLEFTHFMMARHLAQDHGLDLCRLCRGPVRSFRMTPLGATLDFCSAACIAEVHRQHLCFKCLRTHTHCLEDYFCPGCTPAHYSRPTVGGLLAAMQQAAWLPKAYLRSSAHAWKLMYIGQEDVA